MVEQELVRFRAERQSQEATVKQQKEQREELEGGVFLFLSCGSSTFLSFRSFEQWALNSSAP